jgi:hypothetical protein
MAMILLSRTLAHRAGFMQCTTGNTNQAWTTTEPNCAETNCGLPDTIAPTTTSCAETNCGIPDTFTASATLTVSDPTVTAAAPEQTHLIHPGNDDSLVRRTSLLV